MSRSPYVWAWRTHERFKKGISRGHISVMSVHVQTEYQDISWSEKLLTFGQRSTGIYTLLCSCGAVFMRTTKRSAGIRISEDTRSCWLGQIKISAEAAHGFLEVHTKYTIIFKESTSAVKAYILFISHIYLFSSF